MFWTNLTSPGDRLRRAMGKWGVAVVVASGLLTAATVEARSPDLPSSEQVVALAALPPEALVTHRRIQRGGPFPFEKDGTVFGNRERLLPARARGHYREYTVKTPGVGHRGARRIVCGGRPPERPEACYYTDDHYSSFRRIVQ